MATEVSRPTSRRAPRQQIGLIEWLRKNLFSTWYNAIITIVLLYIVVQAVTSFVSWMVTAPGWPAAFTNIKLLLTWTYPVDQLWRPQAAMALVLLLLGLSAGVWGGTVRMVAFGAAAISVGIGFAAFTFPDLPDQTSLPGWLFMFLCAGLLVGSDQLARRLGKRLRWPLIIAWLLSYPAVILILRGGLGLPIVETKLWGGLLLTLLLAISGIVLSFPLGVLLALGRRSSLPVIRVFCVLYIELIRGVPLVTVLFMGALLLPLFIPGGESIDALVRAIVAVTLFSAAYLAENVRGGLQSIPKGQIEAARALGLNVFQTTLLITLPQALRAVVPVLVGQFIALFKDTSLVVIIGLVDLLGAAQNIVGQPQWLGTPGGVWRETFLVIAAIYWVFSFTMSRISKRIEDQIARSRH
ncbi:MAG TPA: amino acid ABC transporter permease [Chloroflexus aurantiacus]|uniref:Polar amino acid ABC transporter, inner membrane subunit n=1 Tax=Chloroflexus aurantiacus (strain ATCC 29366 / DSM 635 / J-10-fl) TaxID=324602 RepID=A9WID6_CHLAA|nr:MULTISPECIES: amino acid ABC transporter permease [Chloroflexus]ABY36428.1 polar amino acid ABC transporter, inner membrane subunit [Chloroflexus aurantiacus J-10-fl]RMG52114.1 MAG: amino acid ABC transporter permease [Chloroflexota bacterium]GIV94631.1 MAG: polar amino acid ABC transporter permease [Chloroflexus sp.]HBW66204.1 amino acid ABC transporter permease [Chloroflexus aurantiacus]